MSHTELADDSAKQIIEYEKKYEPKLLVKNNLSFTVEVPTSYFQNPKMTYTNLCKEMYDFDLEYGSFYKPTKSYKNSSSTIYKYYFSPELEFHDVSCYWLSQFYPSDITVNHGIIELSGKKINCYSHNERENDIINNIDDKEMQRLFYPQEDDINYKTQQFVERVSKTGIRIIDVTELEI